MGSCKPEAFSLLIPLEQLGELFIQRLWSHTATIPSYPSVGMRTPSVRLNLFNLPQRSSLLP
jgi:hypothetical protein